MGEEFGYILLILRVDVPNGVNGNLYFGPFNDDADAVEWSELVGIPIGMFTMVKMQYPSALYPDPIA